VNGWLLVGYGFGVGVILMTFGVWLPSRAYWRRKLDDLRDISRIERGIRVDFTVEPVLEDARGAFAAAKAAYLPVYPGRGEPDPAWISWVEQTGFAYIENRGYRPSHGSALPSPAPAPEPDPFPLDRTSVPHPVIWGVVCACGRCMGLLPSRTATWGLAWAWHEWMLVPLVLVLAFLDRPGRYPWWQRVLDRTWEAGVVLEVSGAHVNRRMVGTLDDLLAHLVAAAGNVVYAIGRLVAVLTEGLAATVEVLAWMLVITAEAAVRPVGWVRRRATRRRILRFRPKRYYPVEEG
jgi:hypothetical protein